MSTCTVVPSSSAGGAVVSTSPTRRPIESVVIKKAVEAVSTAAAAAKSVSTTHVKVSSVNVSDETFHLTMIAVLGCVLTQLVAFEDTQYPEGRGGISMFHTAYTPSISISAYLKRIALYSKISTEVMIQSVLHVHQLMQRTHNPLIVNKLNIHRLLLTSIMSSAKFFDDAHYNNSYYAYVGGVPLKELNALEVEFLSLLNFDFHVSAATYGFFYKMCTEENIHLGGCACAPLLPALPKTLRVDEYVPSSEIDWSSLLAEIPVDETMEDVHPVNTSAGSLDQFYTPLTASSSAASSSMLRSGAPSSLGSAASSTTITPVAQQARVVYPVSGASSASTATIHAGSYGMDELHMSEELGSIRIIEEDDIEVGHHEAATPMAVNTPDAAAMMHHAESHEIMAARTPKQLSAEHLQIVHQHHQQRSASPVSSLLSNSVNQSPVSSVGSYSSLASSSYRSRAFGGGKNGGHAHGSHFSPSISVSGSSSLSHADIGGGRYGYHHGKSASFCATPRQTSCLSATPLACSMSGADELQ